MHQRKKRRTADISIQQFSKEGHGIGSIQFANASPAFVEVPFTIPGDEARATLYSKRKGIYTSSLEELIKPSPDRITPKCLHFASCGGCRWQQISYEKQLHQKESFIQQCFAPYLSPAVALLPIIPCDPPWHYRNKMEFSFSSDKAKNRFLGLNMQGGKGRVFNITECHLTNAWFIEAVKAVDVWWGESGLDAYHPGTNTGSLRTLTVREGMHTGDRMVMLTVSGNADFALHKKHLTSFIASLRSAIEPNSSDAKLSLFLRIQQIGKGMPTQFYEMLLYGPDHIRETLTIQESSERPPRSLTFHISPTAFFQPNTKQAERLYSEALRLAKVPEQSVVYDLYCGTGTLGLCASKIANQVIGIELSRESVLDARTNATLNGANNFTVYQGDVGRVLNELKLNNALPQPHLVMVDPPRMGLDDNAINQLIALHPEKILYISCNPLSQSANIGALIAEGYQLVTLQPVDQFPQTVHIENIAILRK